jgi:hypothetical protein
MDNLSSEALATYIKESGSDIIDEHGEINPEPELIRNHPEVRKELDELSGLVREIRNRGLNGYKRLGDRFTAEKERLSHGEFEAVRKTKSSMRRMVRRALKKGSGASRIG